MNDGRKEYFDAQGKLRTEFSVEKGRIHGKVRLFYSGGKLKREMELSYGTVIRDTIYDEDGKILYASPE